MQSTPEILIVDDRKHNLFALAQTLRDVPARLVTATSGNEALELSLRHEFALALLDVQMPEMDGYELAELLLGQPATASLPIIFLSAAYADDDHRFKGYEAGAVDYLVKPVDPTILRSKVKVFLELARMRAELQSSVRERTRALAAKAEQLARRNDFRKLLAAISRDLTQRVDGEAHAGVHAALGQVARAIGASHAGVHFRSADEGGEARGVLAWNAPGEAPAFDRGTEILSLLALPELQRGEGVAVEQIDFLPDAHFDVRERLTDLGVRAALLLPIIEESKSTGVVCFGFRRAGAARDDLTELLALLPDLILGTIRRAEAEAQRELSRQQHQRILQVEAESKAKSQFLASMSHEIRTPMNAVLGYTQLLLREAGLCDRQREYLETIDRSGEHLLTIINNVLDMARIESGADTLDVAVHDLGDVLTDVERMFRIRAAERGLSFRVVREPGLPGRLHLDGGKVRQVLVNLLGNAMKFARGGAVTLRAASAPVGPDRHRLSLTVEDTGIGIPSDQVSNIFEPFVQVAPGAARTGTGLGLAVSRRFARLMRGDVSVSSTLGVGSTFRFELEATSAADAPAGASEPRIAGLAPDSPPIRVLVVEDNEESRILLIRMLDAVGIPVRSGTTVAEGVAAFAKEPCDIVLCDMRLPDGEGLDVMREVRRGSGGARVPFVIVSASTLQQDRERALSAGVDGFVGKPVREAILFREIARLTPARFLLVGGGESEQPPARPADDPEAPPPIPPSRRDALVAALRAGYPDEITRAVEAAAEAAPGLAKELRKLSDGFEYPALLALLGAEEPW